MWEKVTDWIHKGLVVMPAGIAVFGIPAAAEWVSDVWRDLKELGRRVVRRLRK